ncbi:hypothetical protein J4Q44_G00261670 [Coregonus suidteri]|uniref:DUF218 domain-containing protein n=1 Tax=Coregonus suidteri TaxID=861788 RepID=A0AAN8L720_9TELE
MGVPRGSILLETEAINTGDNICFSYRLLKERNIPANRVILVQQPFMERRVFATFLRQWPAIVTSRQMGLCLPPPHCGHCHGSHHIHGVLERICDYPQKGFQVEQEITPSALSAYHWFLQAGYIPK